ncbi:hypothetical protein ABIB15_000808 [Marisediminicola sp. UYEF4]|uniref:DUF3093 domain-containing protein n=1 Tax=Marisediminicola sp. UYEF4 TaxID=1756384 RepID=UPI00339429A6
MQLYRERLWPSVWVFVSTALVIPASLLVFLPINPTAGVWTAVVLYAGCVVALVATSPVIEVTDAQIIAGRARLPVALAGPPEAFVKQEATLERGQRLDARAWLVIRGWVSPVVKIPVTDPVDPAPYWLVSTRRPALLADAIERARSGAA